MKVYRDSRISEVQKEKVRLCDKQRAAAHRLKQKMSSDEQREKWRKEKSNYRQKWGNKFRIPEKSEQFEKLVNDICQVAKSSPKKANILVRSFASHGFVDKITSKSISILQLQSLKNKNRVKEHEKLVSDIKKQYGSLRKASVALKVPWKTFHRLCQKLKKRKKMVRDQWVEIKKFYTRDNILTELPNIKTAGRHYLTKTL